MKAKLPQPPKDFLIKKIQEHFVPALIRQLNEKNEGLKASERTNMLSPLGRRPYQGS